MSGTWEGKDKGPDMIQNTYRLNSIDEIPEIAEKIHEKPVYRSAGCKVLLAWAQLWNEDDFTVFRQEVLRHFQGFVIIGSNCHSYTDILTGKIDGSGEERGCLLTFMFFENSGASLYGIRAGFREEERQGRELKQLISDTKDARGVFLVPSDYFSSTEDILRELKELKDIPVFGLKTSLNTGYSSFGYEPGREVMEGHLLALIFRGESLNIRTHYNLGWVPVGKTMTVTKEENPFFVDEIDGKPASFVYNKYLGLRNDQIIPQNLSEFPLIIDRNGVRISRIGITGPKDGQLVFGAPVYLNDRISLSYGNSDDLFEEVNRDTHEIAAFEAQAGLLIVCANRVMFLKERELEEIELYRKQIRETAAVYGYGEIFYLNGYGGELNSALVSVFFKETGLERPVRKTVHIIETAGMEDLSAGSGPSNDLIVPFYDRLSRMFKEMSGDLIAAVKEAEDANRAKSAFYSAVSHEVRTPLNSILGMNEMILKECNDEDILTYSENIKSSGRLLQQLINDILDTGKLEAGKMEIIPVDYNVREVMDELAGMIAYSTEEKGLKLEYSVDEELPDILFGDEKRISQCILNLLSNAVKYTDEGVVTFSVSGDISDKDHVLLKISVKDSGIGIKPEDIEKLSIPFERVDKSKNYRVEGTGLGLNIVNNLLALMDSRLKVESVYGEGSEFSFEVMQGIIHSEEEKIGADKEIFRSAEQIGTARTGSRRSARSAGQIGADKEFFRSAGQNCGDEIKVLDEEEGLMTRDTSILVVDDTRMNLTLVGFYLKNSGIDIDNAQNGYTAIEMMSEKKYDIIFLDLKMPGIDGVEVFRKIKEDENGINAGSVFILLTADEEEGIRGKFGEEGFSDFMSKPFTSSMLEDMIRKHLPKEKII